MTEPYLHVLYCDDLRHEFDGKVTMVGVYTSAAASLASYPAQVPKLTVLGWFVCPIDTNPDSFVAKVFLNDEELSQLNVGPIPATSLSLMPGFLYPEDKKPAELMSYGISLTLSPLNLEKPSTLRFKVYVGDKEYKGAALEFVQPVAPPAQPS